jgi:spore maturation protein CgeB
MTWFKDGSHDRVFNGMLARAVAMTDTSGYMKEVIAQNQNGIMFELQEIEALPAVVENILGNDSFAQSVADAGYELARNEHMMKHRAIDIARTFLN